MSEAHDRHDPRGQELAASEKRYRDLVETSHDLIWSVDEQGRWTFLNRAASLRIYGREPEELLGHAFTELQPPEQRVKDLEVFARILAGESHFEYETMHLHKDGSPVHLSFNAIVLRDATGSVVGTTGTATDISERKRAEAEREQMNLKLLQTQKLESLGVLAGGIAHDFNNLLVGILGNADMALLDLPLDAPARVSIEGVRDAALQAADLARQMLAYSGRGKFVIERLDLSRTVKDLLHLLSAVISKNAALEVHAQADLPAIEGDATQVRQVIMNLITNASDALGGQPGRIVVTTGLLHADARFLAGTFVDDRLPAGDYVFVEVTDDGCGMDHATVARIFEPFYSTRGSGRGLGLAAALGIVRGHKGAIRVQSTPGKGTTIQFLLPAVAAPAETVDRIAASGAGPPAGGRASGVVLVVDDEAMVRSMSKRILERAGFEVLTASDGREALALFLAQRARISVVLLDMSMPHMSGDETFQELRRIDPGVRVVLTSGFSEEDVDERFSGRGLAGFVPKPATRDQLVEALRAAIES